MKSNTVIYGYDNVKTTRKKQNLVLACSTATDKNITKLLDYCERRKIALVKLNGVTLSELTNKENVKFIGLTNYELSKAIFSLSENFEIIKRGNF